MLYILNVEQLFEIIQIGTEKCTPLTQIIIMINFEPTAIVIGKE